MIDSKRTLKLLGNLGLCALALVLTALLYNQRGFFYSFAFMLILCALVVSWQMLHFYRRVGTLPAWAAMVALFIAPLLITKDMGTGLLISALSISIPFAVSLFWPRYRQVSSLTKAALPAAGLFVALGTLGYCRLHFGAFSFAPMVEQIAQNVQKLIQKFAVMMAQLSPVPTGTEGQQLQQIMGAEEMVMEIYAFSFIAMIVYALFGVFFAAIFLADYMAQREGAPCWCKCWRSLIPGRGISWIYMLANIGSIFISDVDYLAWNSALNLFGFFYVFTALYRLERYLKKKNWTGFVRGILIVLLFLFAFFTVNSAGLGAYTILFFAGWWIATAPPRPMVRR